MKITKEISEYMAKLARIANAKRPKEFYQKMAAASAKVRKEKARLRGVDKV